MDAVTSMWSSVALQLSEGKPEFESPAVCILVAVVQKDLGESQQLQQLLKWCVANRFELIEWTAQDDEDAETEDGGVTRLSEALQAHVWPDMSLKSDETSSVSSNLAAMSSEEQKLLAEGFNEGEDPGGENFEQLFAKFAEMKEHASKLSHDERKVYAEKVVMAFWDAIGGDEEEVKDSTEK